MQRCGGDHIQPPAIGLNLSKLSSSRVRLLCWQADHWGAPVCGRPTLQSGELWCLKATHSIQSSWGIMVNACPPQWKPSTASHRPTTFLWVEPAGIPELDDAPSKVLDFQSQQKTVHLPDCLRARTCFCSWWSQGHLKLFLTSSTVLSHNLVWWCGGAYASACRMSDVAESLGCQGSLWKDGPLLRASQQDHGNQRQNSGETCCLAISATASPWSPHAVFHGHLLATSSCWTTRPCGTTPSCTQLSCLHWSHCRPPLTNADSVKLAVWILRQCLRFCPRTYEQAVVQAMYLRCDNAHRHCQLESHIRCWGIERKLLRRLPTWLGCCACKSQTCSSLRQSLGCQQGQGHP